LEQRIQERTSQLVEANTELEAFWLHVSTICETTVRAVSGYSTLVLETEAEHSVKRVSVPALNVDNTRRHEQMVDDL